MLNFKNIELSDLEAYKKYAVINKNFSCENAFANLVVWQPLYHNMMAEENGTLFIKSGLGENEVFRIPKGGNLKVALELIKEYCGDRLPRFFVQEGESLALFKSEFEADFCFCERRDSFDYVYLREDLATLSGKKYHSKRNHIALFSKKFSWFYKPLTDDIIPDIKACAEQWYKENEDRLDSTMVTEKNGINLLLDNKDLLSLKGGAIYAENRVVAFTLGTPINSEVFDIHIEKALEAYAEGYTVINREFAKNELSDYKYINREDDMGLEGLRKAKLSYKPVMMIKKYSCISREESAKREDECRKIFHKAFFDGDADFEDNFFKYCFGYCRYTVRDGKVVSLVFALPCSIVSENGKKDAVYIYGATTDENYRNQGLMTGLIESITKDKDKYYFLRPADESLVEFYKKFGFVCIDGCSDTDCRNTAVPKDDFKLFCDYLKDKADGSTFKLMASSEEFEELGFINSME